MSYVRKEQIERAKQIDLLTYLQCFEPYELVRCSRNTFSTRTHDSLKISNGKWFWWSRGIGGRSALDYLIKVRGLSFPDAVMQIDGNPPVLVSSAAAQRDSSHAGLELPEPYETSNRVIAYLCKRGISRDVIDFCLESGRLYESRMYHNAVFVGFDLEGTPRYAAIRGTTKTRYMGEVTGSDKRFSFAIPALESSQELHLFECGIDLLSHCSLELIIGKNWRKSHLKSLGGIYGPKEIKDADIAPVAITHYLQCYPEVNRLVLHLDNDEPGHLAAAMIHRLYDHSYEISDERPIRKDVNDDLMFYRKQRQDQTR